MTLRAAAPFSFPESVRQRSSRCAAALNMTSWVSESLIDMGNRPFAVMRPSQPRPFTDASPGSGDRPGLRVIREVQSASGLHTHALIPRESQSFLRVRGSNLSKTLDL